MEAIRDKNINELIEWSKKMNLYHRGYKIQIEIMDNSLFDDFMYYCENLSTYSFVDNLGPGEFARRRTKLQIDDVISNAHTAIACGIGIVHFPILKINEWENWENGYIEGFIRMNDENNMANEYFIWQYIPMKNLKKILTDWKEHLYLL